MRREEKKEARKDKMTDRKCKEERRMDGRRERWTDGKKGNGTGKE